MPPVPASSVLQLRGVRKRFGALSVIQGVDLEVHRGERHAVIGPNGAGKSTLFNLVSGLLDPTEGEIHLLGHRVTGMKAHHRQRLGLARSFQVTNVFPRLSVFENVRIARLRG